MDTLTVILIAVVLIVVVAVAFVLFRKKQRSGNILAAPNATNDQSTPNDQNNIAGQSTGSSTTGAPITSSDHGEQR